MHSGFDAEMERQEKRLDNKIFEPPVVGCLADIRRILTELDPKNTIAQTSTVSSKIRAIADGKAVVYAVKAHTDIQNKRSIILRGFEFIKARHALEEYSKHEILPTIVNDRPMVSYVRPALDARVWIDSLLKRWFNASRDGLRICWVIPEGKFLYDPFEHRLFKSSGE